MAAFKFICDGCFQQENLRKIFTCQAVPPCAFVLTPSIGELVHEGKNGKAVPLQAWSGPEGSRKLRFPDFMTTAQDSGKVVNLTHRPPLPPRNPPGTHIC